MHTRQTASNTDQQRILVSPQVGKSSVFGYAVTNGLEKLSESAPYRKWYCAKSSWNQVFSTLQILPLLVQLLTSARHWATWEMALLVHDKTTAIHRWVWTLSDKRKKYFCSLRRICPLRSDEISEMNSWSDKFFIAIIDGLCLGSVDRLCI